MELRLLLLLLAQIERRGIVELIQIDVLVLFVRLGGAWRMHAQILGLGLLGHVTGHVHDLWRRQAEDATNVLSLAARVAAVAAVAIDRAGAVLGQIEWSILIQAALGQIYRLLRAAIAGAHGSKLCGRRIQGSSSRNCSRCGHGIITAHGWRESWSRRRLDATFVIHQMMAPAELHVAAFALERLLPVVHQHVRLQLIRVAELSVTDLAGVGPLAGVDTQMATEVGHLHELAIAVGAMVGLLAGVQPHVRLQMMVTGEALVALGALERLLAGVGALVVLQHVLVAKAARADLAGEALVARGILDGGAAGSASASIGRAGLMRR